MIVAPSCIHCKHLWLGKSKKAEKAVCAAFPEGIPELIHVGVEKHFEPYPGDHGIQFEPREEEPPLPR